MQWIHVLQMPIFHWSSHVDDAMMWKAEQPTTKSCRNKVSMNTLPWNDACISGFSAWVHSKTIFTRFHSQSAVGRGVHKAQFFRRRSGSKISIHKALCHDARIWPSSCLACFYAWAHLVIPLALCTLCRLFNFNSVFENFLGSLYGAQQCLQNIFHEGGFFVEPLKKHDYKEALVIKIARFSRKTN